MTRRSRLFAPAVVVVLVATLTLGISCRLLFGPGDAQEDSDGSTGSGPGDTGDVPTGSTRETAQQVELDTRVTRTISAADEAHWFVFQTANAGAWDQVELSITNVASSLTPVVTLFDDAGERVGSSIRAAGPGERVDYSHITPGGRYYARVASHHSGTTGRYRFRVRNLFANDSYAGNHSQATAYDLGSLPFLPHGDQESRTVAAAGVILSPHEEDWFRFTTARDGVWDRLFLRLTDLSETLALRMELFDASGNRMDALSIGMPGVERSFVYPTPGGTYYVMLTPAPVNGGQAHGGTGSYTLQIKNRHESDRYEPNDTREDAYDLGTFCAAHPIAEVYGNIIWTIADGSQWIGGDQDWFRFRPTDNAPFSVRIDHAHLILNVTLLQVRDGEETSYTASYGPGENVSISTTEMPGITPNPDAVYYLRIRGTNDGDHGKYMLSVRRN